MGRVVCLADIVRQINLMQAPIVLQLIVEEPVKRAGVLGQVTAVAGRAGTPVTILINPNYPEGVAVTGFVRHAEQAGVDLILGPALTDGRLTSLSLTLVCCISTGASILGTVQAEQDKVVSRLVAGIRIKQLNPYIIVRIACGDTKPVSVNPIQLRIPC